MIQIINKNKKSGKLYRFEQNSHSTRNFVDEALTRIKGGGLMLKRDPLRVYNYVHSNWDLVQHYNEFTVFYTNVYVRMGRSNPNWRYYDFYTFSLR